MKGFKIVHFIRHGQSFYNASKEAFGRDPGINDAELTSLGKQQATNLSLEINKIPNLILVSPLSRAIQTMQIAFDERSKNENIPIFVSPHLRERVTASDDLGSPPDVLSRKFPTLDFSHLDRVWWFTNSDTSLTEDPDESKKRYKEKPFREPRELVHQRVEKFRKWLATRNEKVIVVIGHSDLTKEMIGFNLKNCQLFTCVFCSSRLVFFPYKVQTLFYMKTFIRIELVDERYPLSFGHLVTGKSLRLRLTMLPTQTSFEYTHIIENVPKERQLQNEELEMEKAIEKIGELVRKDKPEELIAEKIVYDQSEQRFCVITKDSQKGVLSMESIQYPSVKSML